jgi:hypothetical protein
MVRGSAVEAARLDDEIQQINERRMPQWRVFASSSGKDFYASRVGKVSPALMEHADFAMTVHAVKLDVLEALMDQQDEIGWLAWMTYSLSLSPERGGGADHREHAHPRRGRPAARQLRAAGGRHGGRTPGLCYSQSPEVSIVSWHARRAR